VTKEELDDIEETWKGSQEGMRRIDLEGFSEGQLRGYISDLTRHHPEPAMLAMIAEVRATWARLEEVNKELARCAALANVMDVL
jgi:flagellar biosynthesis/type III secretory pathway protein FliH